MTNDSLERLQKVLARAGIASRRKAETMIAEGRVAVNGQIVTALGTKVDPTRDDIRVDGQRLTFAASYTYVLVNKPRGVLSVMEDERGRRSLGDLVPLPARLYPVGRLDMNSEGLMLLTDDGELANLLTHPRYEHDKEYRVSVNGHPSDKTLEAWRRGVVLEGRRTAPAEVEVIRKERDSSLLRITMHEGRKRQIRDVAGLLGHPVRQLVRVRIGPLELGELAPGQWRYLTPRELSELEALKRPGARAKRRPVRERPTGALPGNRRPVTERSKGPPSGKRRPASKRPRGTPAADRPRSRRPRPDGRPKAPPKRDGSRR